jgi:hypothetical protein
MTATGAMVLLHDHLNAFLDLGQHAVNIPGEFGFCDSDRRHDSTIARSLAAARIFLQQRLSSNLKQRL